MQPNRGVMASQGFLVAFILIAWEFIGRSSARAFFLVGTPRATAREFYDLAVNGRFISHFLITGSEAFLGLLIGTIAGSIAGLFLWYSDYISRVSRPFILAFGTLPVLALAPLMIVWFGVGFEMKVAMATFSTIFVSFSQASKGAGLVAGEYVDMMRGLGASRSQVFRKVVVPGSIEWVLGSMRLNVGFGLLGAFIGEFIASNQGLGYVIIRAGGLYNVPRVFAAAMGIVLLALMFDRAAAWVETRRFTLLQWLSVPRAVWT